MKEKVIEVAGKTWKTLAQKGAMKIDQLPTALKENESVVYQALGWLAREDKINYSVKNKQTFVSLVDAELKAFKNTIQNAKQQSVAGSAQSSSAPAAKKRVGI